MKNDEFDKLFKYMAKRFDALEKKIDSCADKKSLDTLRNGVDTLIKDYKSLTDDHFADVAAHRRIDDALVELDGRLNLLENAAA
ncbi:hypothetical protein FWD20_03455 [Candidatus Saccharibacteria bacterium]|nr:hypothetical protein [Candidatus Saccharibacteria bacterium]